MAIKSVKNKTRSGSLLIGNSPYVPPSFESIATATGTGSSPTITFSSIPSTYKHLQLRILGRTDNASTGALVEAFVNGDTGQNYAFHRLQADGTSASANGGASQFSIQSLIRATGASAAANIMTASIIDIHDYTSTTKAKTIRSFYGFDFNGSGNVYLGSGLWTSTSAVTSLTLTAVANWTTNSVFSLYGIKG